MNSPLLPKNTTFANAHEKLIVEIQLLRTKNNQFQRMSTDQFQDPEIGQEIVKSKKLVQAQIQHIKSTLSEMQSRYRQPHQKSKMKETRKQFEKQCQRFKFVLQNLSEKQFMTNMRSIVRSQSIHSNTSAIKQQQAASKKHNSSLIEVREQNLEFQYNLTKEKTKKIHQSEEKLENIRRLHEDIGNMVLQQGQKIDVIGENIVKAHENVEGANEQLDQAQKNQKKASRKSIILVGIIIVVLLAIVGIYFIIN